MSEKWYSPFSKNNVKEVDLSDDNSLIVTPNPGTDLEAIAMYDGFLIYKPEGDPQSTVSGDLELVFYPATWSAKLRKSFDWSKWTELPPGRVVYKNIPSDIVRQGIHELIFKNYMTNKNHIVLSYIPEAFDQNATVIADTIKGRLDSVSNCAANNAEREQNINDEINEIVDIFIKRIHEKELDGISVLAGDVLFKKTDVVDKLTLEIRNLYGEALNPIYYIKKSDVYENSEYEAIFQRKPITDIARKKLGNTMYEIKIPRNGGIEYTMLNTSGNNRNFKDSGYYKSRLIWEYTFDNTINAYKAKATVRPGSNATVSDITVSRAPVKATIENIWNDLHEYINKYTEIFEVPAEVAMAIIYVEATKVANKVINHSIRIEKSWKPEQDYPKFYADLMDYIKSNVNSSFGKETIDKYWALAGGYINSEEGFLKPPKINEIKIPPIAELPVPYNEGEKLSAKNKINITWKQLMEMATVCPQLLQGIQITVPALGKSDGKYHYDLIKDSASLGEKAAELYFTKAGGIKLASGKEVPSKNAVTITPPSPLNMNAAITELSNDAAVADKRITWLQLIEIFRIFKSNGINVPLIKYKLQPLAKDPTKKVTGQDIAKDEDVRNKLGLDEANSQLLLDQYQKLWTKSLIYTQTLGPSGNIPGIKAAGTNDSLTMEEVKKLSKLFPGKISIGIQQSLFETAASIILPYITKHYISSTNFFTANVTSVQNVTKPEGTKDQIIDWLWKYAWDSYEIQIILLIAYIKRNSVYYWQGVEADNKDYRVGERMTSFDFPKVAAAYNSGDVRIHSNDNKKPTDEHESDWGCFYACNYLTGVNTEGMFALNEAFILLSQQTDASKKAVVRLAPVLEADTGMGKY